MTADSRARVIVAAMPSRRAPSPPLLSAYELQRNETIAANHQVLVDLGIVKPKLAPPLATQSKKRTPPDSAAAPVVPRQSGS